MMKISHVSVRYGELRSSGYPSFSNTRHEVELSASLEPGDTANDVKETLLRHAKSAVRRMFGDKASDEVQMDIPF
jgi:hypothetical protein